MARAVERARAGQGPTLLDCRTYRFMGHYFGDQMAYMDKDELAARMADDPRRPPAGPGAGRRGGRRGRPGRLSTPRSRAEVAAAIETARAAPDPDADEVFDDVWAVAAR